MIEEKRPVVRHELMAILIDYNCGITALEDIRCVGKDEREDNITAAYQ